MISMKTVTLLLVLFLVTGRFSGADIYQDGNLARGVKVVSTEEEILDDKLAFRFGGRKSMVKYFNRPKTVETKGSTAGTRTLENSNGVAPRSNHEGKGRILLSDHQDYPSAYSYSYEADYNASMPARNHPPHHN